MEEDKVEVEGGAMSWVRERPVYEASLSSIVFISDSVRLRILGWCLGTYRRVAWESCLTVRGDEALTMKPLPIGNIFFRVMVCGNSRFLFRARCFARSRGLYQAARQGLNSNVVKK